MLVASSILSGSGNACGFVLILTNARSVVHGKPTGADLDRTSSSQARARACCENDLLYAYRRRFASRRITG